MIFRKVTSGAVTAGLLVLAGIGSARAELPTMNERAWLGHFLGFETKKYRFGMTDQGKAMIQVLDKQGKPLAKRLDISVDFLVEEFFPDGKITARTIRPTSLESPHPASNNIDNAVIRGTATGDARFEIFLNEERGVLSLGGRMLDPGSLKNPTRFSIQLRFPEVYPSSEFDDKRKTRAFESKLRGDRLQLTWTDNKRVRQSIGDKIDASSAEVNGPGIAAVQIDFSTHEGNRFEIATVGNSAIRLSNNGAAPLHTGFNLNWTADPEKDPEGKARLVIEVR